MHTRKSFECSDCSKCFTTKQNLHHHYITHTKEKLHSKKELGTEETSNYHIIVNNGVKLFVCNICNKKFKLKWDLRRHLYVHTSNKERPHECTICHKRFSLKGNLKSHHMVHTKEKPYECIICLKGFSRKGILKQHYDFHTRKQSFKCNDSSNYFETKRNLQLLHSITHTEEDILDSCGICETQETPQSIVHQNEKSSEDSNCFKQLKNKIDLDKYFHVHTSAEKRNYKCTVCQKSFSREGLLKKHNLVHSNKPHICNICGKRCLFKASLVIHYRVHTGERPYECDVCFKKFSTESGLNQHFERHIKEKPYECSVCHKGFLHKRSLNRHHGTHIKDKPYKCNICEKYFRRKDNLDDHYGIHTEGKPYKCKICLKSFVRESYLRSHYLKIHATKEKLP